MHPVRVCLSHKHTLLSKSWQHAWTDTDAWNTTKPFTQTRKSLKLSTADNWSESTLMHISNTCTDSPVTLLTFDPRWRGLLSNGVDSFSACEVISCQCHCEGQKRLCRVTSEGGTLEEWGGGWAESYRAKAVLCKKFSGSEPSTYCIKFYIIASKMNMRVSEDRKGVIVWVNGVHMCLCVLWQTGGLPRGYFCFFRSGIFDTGAKKCSWIDRKPV